MSDDVVGIINLDTDERLPLVTAQEVLEQNINTVGDPRTADEGRPIFIHQLNIAVESKRATFTTSGAVQAMVYQEKVEQATDFLVNGDSLEKYPLLSVEVKATGKSAKIIANNILDQRGDWLKKISATEGIRLIAIGKMKRAKTYDGIVRAYKSAQAELNALDF